MPNHHIMYSHIFYIWFEHATEILASPRVPKFHCVFNLIESQEFIIFIVVIPPPLPNLGNCCRTQDPGPERVIQCFNPGKRRLNGHTGTIILFRVNKEEVQATRS